MIDFKEHKIGPSVSSLETILAWEVWFMTPGGLHETFESALAFCTSNDFDPNLIIQPIPVARGSSGYYEIVIRQ